MIFVILLISSCIVLIYNNFPLYAVSAYGLPHIRHLPQKQYVKPRAEIRAYQAEDELRVAELTSTGAKVEDPVKIRKFRLAYCSF